MDARPRRATGIEPVGFIPRGTHFCEFYRDKQDLIDTLIPYFAADLRGNELCVWVTTDALERHEAEELLARAVPHFDRYVDRGQIEFHDHRDWYVRAGSSLTGVLEQWIAKEHEVDDNRDAGESLAALLAVNGHEVRFSRLDQGAGVRR